MPYKTCPRCQKYYFAPNKAQVYCSITCFWGPVSERFWSKVDIKDPDSCWNYTGGTNSEGRGVFSLNDRSIGAHRVAYELTNGPIPDGILVCHKCDNGRCCNPNHLFLGTHADNVHDMINKGRRRLVKGEKHYIAKLTEQQVREIRKMYKTSGLSQEKIARLYGVGRTTIQQVVEGRAWRHVK